MEDRGFQFGDGLYEVIHVYDGKFLLLKEHMDRLRRGAEAICLPYDFERHPLEPILAEGVRRSGLRDARVYLQITRGVAPRDHVIPEGLTPTVVATFKPRTLVPDELRRRGATVMTTPEIRWAWCAIKAITLLPNVLAKTEAKRRGYDDAVFVTADGEVRECTASNVFMVRDGRVFMPPRNESVLHGITQLFLLECAASAEIPVVEEPIRLEAFRQADEAFMSSTAVDVLGITSVDDRPIGDGQVGPITRRLYEAFVERIPTRLTAL
ncbi:MAG: amino acid aminotransferase [Planctomycetota bacterium]|nr:MAG: amino acid aminotransferase [Planctomycetota bacterium]